MRLQHGTNGPLLRAHVLDHPGSNKVGAERFDIFSIEIERIRDLGSRRSQRMHVEPLQDSHVIVREGVIRGRGWKPERPRMNVTLTKAPVRSSCDPRHSTSYYVLGRSLGGWDARSELVRRASG